MKKIFTREVRVGLMVIIAIFLLYFGLNFLKGIDIFRKSTVYYGKFEQLDGLVKSSPVQIKGFKVGQVSNVQYDFSKKEAFTVEITISSDIKLPVGAVMTLTDDGLLGGKIISLDYQPITANQTMYKSQDIIPTRRSSGLMDNIAGTLMPKIEKVTDQADSLLLSVRKLTENPHISNSLIALEKTTNELASTSSQLKIVMTNQIPSVMNNINDLTGDFKQFSGNLKKIDFAQTMEQVDYTVKNLQSLTQKINSQDNSLGLLLNDKELYINLKNTTSNANKLMIDLKENPKRYVHFSVFGGSSK